MEAEETPAAKDDGSLPKVEEPVAAVPTGSATDTETQER